jgi:hypothetical protein
VKLSPQRVDTYQLGVLIWTPVDFVKFIIGERIVQGEKVIYWHGSAYILSGFQFQQNELLIIFPNTSI